MTNTRTLVTGMRPSGILHLGNYVGALKELLKLQHSGSVLNVFSADLHALTEIDAKTNIREATVDTTRLYLACGIDPEQANFYRQSDISAISEIALQLSMIVSEGQLLRCTTYKDKKNQKAKSSRMVSAGLLQYPVLMCADIIAVRGELVPVGEDQLQHLEMARDFVQRLNSMFSLDVPLPYCPSSYEPLRLSGLDGSGKMGKSDGNTISLLDSHEAITKTVMSAVTDNGLSNKGEMSTPLRNLFQYMELFCPEEVVKHYRTMYEEGHRKFYGDLKATLASGLCDFVGEIRDRYHHDPLCSVESANKALEKGADIVNPIANAVRLDIKNAMNY